ncbi:GDSL-type esterase/lipase family protein [Ancylomarina longa]|uniref:GDSL family lipase n=1 Tax=Ancylomarina longa TaxID=2487017 RepID=A0A434AFG9_9BACT|nr:GDSL-type esterase/lipase family protein [Ancylomarina longa]RUT73092.1 GDSL family lipase [Ancylomarina longa]
MSIRIAFVGDSLTHGGRWQEFFPNQEIANFGVPGEKSSQILARFDQVIAWNPKKIFLMMGINDLGEGLGVEIILRHYQEIIARIKEIGQVELYVQSLLPINPMLFTNPKLSKNDIVMVNYRLQELCENENISFINLYSCFSNYGNELISEYTYDGLHLNEAGYKLWVNRLRSDQLLQE